MPGATAPCQAEIVPSRLAKMKRALMPSSRWKDPRFVLETCPVGPWGFMMCGICTVRATGETSVVLLPGTEWGVAKSVAWSEIQKGLPRGLACGGGINETPQGFTKFESISLAPRSVTSETRF